MVSIDEALDTLNRAKILVGGDAVLVACLKSSGLEDVHIERIDVVRDSDSRYVEILVNHPVLNDKDGSKARVITVYRPNGPADVFENAKTFLFKDGSGVLSVKHGDQIELFAPGQWTRCVLR